MNTSPQTLRGSFSAVSKRIFAKKILVGMKECSLESSWRDLQDSHTFLKKPRDAIEVQSGKTNRRKSWVLWGPGAQAIHVKLYKSDRHATKHTWFASYQKYKLLHRSAFKNSAKFRQTCSHFYGFIFEISLIFRNVCPNLTNFDENFPEFQQICWKRSKSPRFSNFLRFRTENYWNFQKLIVEKLEKR